jgi:pilus assembly protein CpaB
VIKAQGASFMSATISPGRRAVSIGISAEQGAGGFILPNDRVDVILTRQVGSSGSEKDFQSVTILHNIRVLAIDQTAKPDNNAQSAVGKTATLELTEEQAELVAQSAADGTLSLALRALGETDAALRTDESNYSRHDTSAAMSVIRYGVARGATVMGRGQ